MPTYVLSMAVRIFKNRLETRVNNFCGTDWLSVAEHGSKIRAIG